MNRIQELRKTKKMTQKQLCSILKIAQPTLSGYENETSEPDFATFQKIADFFGVTVDYLLGREDRMPTPQNPIQEYTEEEKQLLDLIMQLNDDEVQELSNFVDYIISKRK